MPMRFEERHSLHRRMKDALRVLSKFPSKIPIIVQAVTPDLPSVGESKFLVPVDMKMGHFVAVIRSKLSRLQPHQALFVMTKGGVMPAAGSLMISVYHENMDPDYFLYLDLYTENAFGGLHGQRATDGGEHGLGARARVQSRHHNQGNEEETRDGRLAVGTHEREGISNRVGGIRR